MVAKNIRHINVKTADDRATLLTMLATAMHLTKGELKVLSVLCSQQTGFSVPAATLMNKTEMSHGGVYKARAALNKMGLIGETATHIIIDWERLRLLSTLDPSMTSRSAYVTPVIPTENKSKAEPGSWKKKVPKEYKPNIDFLVYAPEETIIKFFQNLSETEYQDVREYIDLTLAH